MCVSFLGLGRKILGNVLGSEAAARLSALEKISLSYLLGTAFFSLLWLLIGLLGGYYLFTAAAVMLLGGIAGILFLPFSSFGNLFSRAGASIRGWTLGEKGIAVVLALFSLLLAANAHVLQPYSDALLTHLSLPNMYIHNHQFFAYPYNVFSYASQGLEMLIVWALLLKSDFAAYLLIWGFFVSLVVIIFGFISRRVSRPAAFWVSLLILSSPIYISSALMIKNDLTAAAFVLAHFLVLSEVWDGRVEDRQRWALLSGLLLGGAIAHKYNAVIPGFVTFLILLSSDFRNRNVRLSGRLIFFWGAGMLIPSLPWFLRGILHSGNPVYPFANQFFFNDHYPWQMDEVRNNILSKPGEFTAYVRSLIFMTRDKNGAHGLPNVGPFALFSLFGFFFFKSGTPKGFRVIFWGALASILLTMCYSMDPRYIIGSLAVLMSVPCAVSLRALTAGGAVRAVSGWMSGIVLVYFWAMLYMSGNLKIMSNALQNILSGWSPFSAYTNDLELNDIRWLFHVVEKNTRKEGTLLLAGIYEGYPLDRKFYTSFSQDRQPISDWAEEAADAAELRDILRKKGVTQILLAINFFEAYKNPVHPGTRIKAENLDKINRLITQFMVRRFEVASGRYRWLSFKDEPHPPVVYDPEDVYEFYASASNQAVYEFLNGNIETANVLIRLLGYDPEKPEIYIQFAEALSGEENAVAALRLCKKILELDPGNQSALKMIVDNTPQNE